MRLATLLIALLLGLLPVTAAKDYQYRHIGMEDHLMSNTIRNIVQDKYGYMWFGTDNGLYRYDGTRTTMWRVAENEVNQYVSALLSTDEGIWVGMEQGVFLLSFQHMKFERMPINIHSVVTSLTLDKDQRLWISTSEQGVWCLQTDSRQSTHYAFNETNGFASQVFVDNTNQVWVLSNHTGMPVSRLNRLHNTFEQVVFNYGGQYTSLRMLQTRDGRLWLGSWDEGLLLMHSNGQLEQVLNPKLAGVGQHIHTLFEQVDNTILVGCDDGLICLNPSTYQWSRLLPSGDQSDRFVYAITSDTEGGLWIGTFYAGVTYVSPVGKRFDGYSTNNGLKGNVIARFCEDPQGRIWIGSDDGGLMCLDANSHTPTNYTHQDELGSANVHALAMQGDQLWIGTYTRGVYVLNTTTGALRHYTRDRQSGSLSDASSYAICHDSQQRTWVGTMRGLDLYDPTTDAFLHIGNTESLVIDIDEDRQHRLWLSTQGNGLWMYDADKQQLKRYVHETNNTSSLPDNQVNCTLIDQSGRMWVGTIGGLCSYDAQNGQFVTVLEENVMGIIEDHGVLWLSTGRGVMRYEPSQTSASIRRFTRHDGLQSEQFQPNSAFQASNGRIFFGTVNGFNAFFPYQIKTNTMQPPVYINAIEVFNQPRKAEDGLPLDLSLTSTIELDYDDAKMISFSFAALSYCSPEKNQYAYMMEGFDQDWNDVGSQTRATYTNLPAGTYTLRVKATNNDGIWCDNEATLRVVVHPPFWWSWPAKLFYLLLVAFCIWYYVRIRLKRAEHRHQFELQRLQEEKEKEVREARLNFFTMIAHEIRTPVSLIIGPLEKIKDKNEELKVIDRNAHRLLELVNQLLDFRKVEQQKLVGDFAPCNISDLLHAVCERFVPTFKQNGKQFSVDYPDEHFTAILDGEALTKVVSNLLTNANKYSKTSVKLSCIVEPDEEHFRIIVSDNGIGIRPEDRERIFEPFFQAQNNKPGTGIGLNIVKSIVDLHHGHITVESEVGQGTTFTVTLPVSQPLSQISQSTPDTQISQPSSIPHTESSASHTLLIVDDAEDMVTFLANHFSEHYQVLTAHDGIEALSLLSKQEVSLIISDWMMPRMDGAELCRQVRSNPLTSHIPFVLLTAKTDDGSKIEGMNIGADAYIEKPFSIEYVEACIRNIITLRRQLTQKFSSEPNTPVSEIAGNPTDNEFLTRMTHIIEENIANDELSVNFLAEQLCISRSGLFAKIKSLADITPNEMIQVIRLKRAASLLLEGRYLVSEVGYKVGFSNPSYFSKCFQKQFGIKPGDYAANAKKQPKN